MHSHLVAIAMALSTSAFPADVGQLSFKDSCVTAQKLEEARGSLAVAEVESPPKGSRIAHVAFQGRYFDRTVHLEYVCFNGQLVGGLYLFEVESAESALQTFNQMTLRLDEIYGPYPSDRAKADQLFEQSNPISQHRLNMWKTPRTIQTLNLLQDYPKGAMGWRVMLTVGPSGVAL